MSSWLRAARSWILVAETSAQAYLAREVTPNGPGAAGAMTPPPGAPATVDDDNLHDGIACGLVPMVEIGRLLGIQSPVMDSLVTLGSLATSRRGLAA